MLQRKCQAFSLIWIINFSSMSWKYWNMMDYRKTKNYRTKINTLIGENRFIDIDWLISVDSLTLKFLPRWFDLFNHNPFEQKHRERVWLTRAQTLQILWDSFPILAHKLNNLCCPYGRVFILRHNIETYKELEC